MATSFFGGAFFGGEFFNTPAPATDSGPTPAGKSTGKSKRRVVIGDRLYEVDSLRDVEFLLKRIVREEEPEPIATKAAGRVRVVDRVRAQVEPGNAVEDSVEVPVDWSALWQQLAVQEMAYADILAKVLMRQEEDDIETILLLMH